jgi:hypothetical protein
MFAVPWSAVTRLPILLLVPAILLGSAHSSPRRRARAPRVSGPTSIIADVSVVDVISGQLAPHRDLLIRAGRIAEIRPAARRLAGTRFVIPGLWDMHVHLWYPDPQFSLYLGNGITGVRDMGSDLKRVRRWQSEIARGALLGPHIVSCGAALSTDPSGDPKLPVEIVHTPQEARKAFDRDYERRVDFIKVLDLSEPAFEALAEASRHDGVPFAGDLPSGVSAFAAARDRMSSMEHLFGLGLACSRKENELRSRSLSARAKKDSAATAAIDTEVMSTYDTEAAATLWDLFRRYDVRQTPTLTEWARMTGLHIGGETDAPELRYMDVSLKKRWPRPESAVEPGVSDRRYEFACRLTGEMARAGVPLLAGTDTGDPWTVPGFELHKELALLVNAGLTPAQALRSATFEPARLLHREIELGQVKKGYLADLVILNANPLADIRNTRRIESVMIGGKQIGKVQIARMLNEMAATAART